MDCDMLYSLLIGIGSGIISSFLFWLILNIVFFPKVSVDDQIQSKNGKEYIRVFNRSWLNVYGVVCRIEYVFENGHKFFRTDQTIPYLHKKDGWYRVILNGSQETNSFFEKGGGEIIIVITYQNRFGIKTSTKPCCLKCSGE